MDLRRRFIFRGNAAAIGGRIVLGSSRVTPMPGAFVSALLWAAVALGYACSVWSLGKVWREPLPEDVARPSAPRLGTSRGGTGHPTQVRDRLPKRVDSLLRQRVISAK